MLKTVKVPININVKWFQQIRKLNPIPSNTIIDKTLPGLGATYTEIKALRNSILILPNVAAILDKDEQHRDVDNTIAVVDGVSQKALKTFLENSLTYKKIITTPESFIKKVKPTLGNAMYLDYFLLIDESHKVISDAGYRGQIVQPMDEFFKFRYKAMISATTLIPSDPRFELHKFKVLKIEPTYLYKKDITVIHTNNVTEKLLSYIAETRSGNYCIFFNSIQGIKSLIDSLTQRFGEEDVTGNCKIYCSKESAGELEEAGINYANRQFDHECLKYNFFTSSFFNGLDIKPEVSPDVIIITDAKYADYTVIDPSVDAWQIQGRFRHTERSIVHLVSTDAKLYHLEPKDIDQRISESERFYRYIEDFKQNASSLFGQDLYKELLSRVRPYANLLNDQKELDPFKVDNYYYAEQIKGNYTTFLKVREAYENCAHFDPKFQEHIYRERGLDGLMYGKGKYSPENYLRVTNILADQPWDPLDIDIARIEEHFLQHFETIVRAYHTLGIELMIKLGFDHELITKTLIYADSLLGRNHHAVIDAIHATFKIGQWYPLSLIKKEIAEIYDSYDLKTTVTAKEIEYYFDVTEKFRTISKVRVKGYQIIEANQNGLYNRR